MNRRRHRKKGWRAVKHTVLTWRANYMLDKRSGWFRRESQQQDLRSNNRRLPGYAAHYWRIWLEADINRSRAIGGSNAVDPQRHQHPIQ